MQSVADQGEQPRAERSDAPLHRQQAERRLPQHIIDELVAGYLEGRPTTKLTHQFRLSNSTVLRLLREQDVPIATKA